MGSFFIDNTLDASVTPAQLRDTFRDWQVQGAYENGHEYSGDWNMLSGIIIEPERHFDSIEDASHYVQEHTQKWESARAVRLTERVPKAATFNGKPAHSFLDACVSALVQREYDKGMEYRLVACDQLTEAEKQRALALVAEREPLEREVRAAERALEELAQRIRKAGEPLPEGFSMATINAARRREEKTRKALTKLDGQLQPLAEALNARLLKAGTSRDVWFVGGWAAS